MKNIAIGSYIIPRKRILYASKSIGIRNDASVYFLKIFLRGKSNQILKLEFDKEVSWNAAWSILSANL